MSGLHTSARIAAAAAITGIAWLGPQALGVATADSAGNSPDAGSSSPARGAHHGSRTPAGSGPIARVVRAANSTRAPAAAVPTITPSPSTPAVEGAPVVRTATPQQSRSSAPVDAVVSAVPAAAARPAAVTAAAVESGPPSSAPTTTTTYSPPKLTLPTLRTVVDAFTPGVVAVIDRVNHWVSTLPASPLTDVVSGALLTLRNELQPPGSGSGGTSRIQSNSSAPTRVTIRNETNAPFDISAYYDGSTSNELVYITSLDPGESWSSTAANYVNDHNLVIGSLDASQTSSNIGKPRMRLIVDSSILWNYITAFFPEPNSENGWHTYRLSENQSKSMSEEPSGLKLWAWRGEDIPSGSWFTYDTTNIVVSIWQLPTGVYDVSNDSEASHFNHF
jgi:hypothetical protein